MKNEIKKAPWSFPERNKPERKNLKRKNPESDHKFVWKSRIFFRIFGIFVWLRGKGTMLGEVKGTKLGEGKGTKLGEGERD
jgi:hypothetical protein